MPFDWFNVYFACCELQPAYHEMDPSFSYRMNVPDNKQQEMLARQPFDEVQSMFVR